MKFKPRVVVLSGAGMSAESGLQTFRGAGGLWEGYRIEEVATPEAWEANPELVLRFYNERRQQLRKVQPNVAHHALVELEQAYDVRIVTQNVDDLHERAGSTHVLHVHGQLMQARSTEDDTLVYDLQERDIELGDCCELGSPLRPHVVWFGEMVPGIVEASSLMATAEVLIIVGTSLVVYPAAGLIHDVPAQARRYYIDPEPSACVGRFECLKMTACEALPGLVRALLADC